MSEEIVLVEEELTIEDVTEYAQEFGFNLLLYGDTYGLEQGGRVLAIGTLEEIYSMIELSEEFAVLAERYSPSGLTIH